MRCNRYRQLVFEISTITSKLFFCFYSSVWSKQKTPAGESPLSIEAKCMNQSRRRNRSSILREDKLTALCTEELAGFSSSCWRGRLKKLSWAGPDPSRGLQFVSILYGLVCMILKWPKQWLIKYSETINFLRINLRTFAIGAPKLLLKHHFSLRSCVIFRAILPPQFFLFIGYSFFFLWNIYCDSIITKSCFLLEGHQFVSVRYVRQWSGGSGNDFVTLDLRRLMAST